MEMTGLHNADWKWPPYFSYVVGDDVDLIVLLMALTPPNDTICFMKAWKMKYRN